MQNGVVSHSISTDFLCVFVCFDGNIMLCSVSGYLLYSMMRDKENGNVEHDLVSDSLR